jgi:TatD DNase family protein
VAIGECGLDYYCLAEDTKAKQRDAFIAQIHLANELNKPLMLHVRGERGDDTPYLDALEILQKEAKVLGNFHFFAGSLEVAKKIWDAGFTTSFTGVITFARVYEKLITEAPLEMIMVETDCPYATPEPHRGKRNEPLHVLEIVKKIARVRGEDEEVVARALVANTLRIFSLE